MAAREILHRLLSVATGRLPNGFFYGLRRSFCQFFALVVDVFLDFIQSGRVHLSLWRDGDSSQSSRVFNGWAEGAHHRFIEIITSDDQDFIFEIKSRKFESTDDVSQLRLERRIGCQNRLYFGSSCFVHRSFLLLPVRRLVVLRALPHA